MPCWRIAIATVAVVGLNIGTRELARADAAIDEADRLFHQAKALLPTDLHAACKKFEASFRLNPHAIGTILNVALCDEKLGRVTSAQARFALARDVAREGNMPDHLAAANEHLSALEPRIPRITIVFSGARLPDTKVVIDDKVIDTNALATLAVDPGSHTLVVSAPGYLPYQTTFQIAEREQHELAIPALAKSVRVTVKSSRRTIGKIVTASGVAALGTSVVLGLVARGRYNSAVESGCNPHIRLDGSSFLQCEPDSAAKVRGARTLGTVGTVVGVTGIVATGVGVALWLLGPNDRTEQRVAVLPHITPESASVVAVGHF